jgi:hypothetical protein
VAFGVAVTTTVGDDGGATVGVGVTRAPQVRLRSFKPAPVASALVSAAVVPSQVKLIAPPGKQGGVAGMVAGTVTTYLPPVVSSVDHTTPSLSRAEMVVPSGTGWPALDAIPV